jgi:putative ABC transport system substrate-binding protein
MRRRDFITLLGGAVATWPFVAQAQQGERVRRIGILTGGPNDALFRSELTAFQKALQHLGWIEGRNVEFNIRSGDNNAERITTEAKELVRFKPDVILVGPSHALLPLRNETSTTPIVFVRVSDPVGQGIVKSLARPSGNITGFSNLEFSLVGKWLQTLKEIAPGIKRVAMIIHTANAVSANWYREFETLAPQFAVEPIAAPINDISDIKRIIETLSRAKDAGLIFPGDTFIESPPNRELILNLVAANPIPAIYGRRNFVENGGLIYYGIDQMEQYRLAATYVDRILKGESPADLPVQQPSKYSLMINLKAAKALGLTISLLLQQLADELIE